MKYYIISDMRGRILSSPSRDDQRLWNVVEGMERNGMRGLMVRVVNQNEYEKLGLKESK